MAIEIDARPLDELTDLQLEGAAHVLMREYYRELKALDKLRSGNRNEVRRRSVRVQRAEALRSIAAFLRDKKGLK